MRRLGNGIRRIIQFDAAMRLTTMILVTLPTLHAQQFTFTSYGEGSSLTISNGFLMGEKHTMRVALDLLSCRERGEWRAAADQARLHGISEDVASPIHFESALWAKNTDQQLACL